jgi:hypothetical protein
LLTIGGLVVVSCEPRASNRDIAIEFLEQEQNRNLYKNDLDKTDSLEQTPLFKHFVVGDYEWVVNNKAEVGESGYLYMIYLLSQVALGEIGLADIEKMLPEMECESKSKRWKYQKCQLDKAPFYVLVPLYLVVPRQFREDGERDFWNISISLEFDALRDPHYRYLVTDNVFYQLFERQFRQDQDVLGQYVDSLKNAGWKWTYLDTLIAIDSFCLKTIETFGT